MTLRQRLLAALSGNKPDVLPWFADLTYYHGAQDSQQKLPERYKGDGILELHKDTGAGICVPEPLFPWEATCNGVETRELSNGDEHIHEIHTPLGVLRKKDIYLPGSYTTATVEHFVKQPDDFKIVRYVLERQEVSFNLERFVLLDTQWGGHGVPFILPPRPPLNRIMLEWAGTETTVYALADAPGEIEKTMKVMEDFEDPIYEEIGKWSFPIVELPANLSSAIISPTLFEKYCMPHYRRRVEQLHESGKKVGVHLDGTLNGLLQMMNRVGFDFVEALTPAPVGDVELEDLGTLAGPEIVLFGGIPGAFFSNSSIKEADFRLFVQRVIKYALNDSKFVIGVADQVPPDADVNRVGMVSELVEQFGRY